MGKENESGDIQPVFKHHAVDGHMDVSLSHQSHGGGLSWLNLGKKWVKTITEGVNISRLGALRPAPQLVVVLGCLGAFAACLALYPVIGVVLWWSAFFRVLLLLL